MNTQRTHRRVDWVSDYDYDMGIIRVGRVSFPGSWAVVPYIFYVVLWIVLGIASAIGGHLVVFWVITALLVIPLIPLAFYGIIPLIRTIRENVRSTLEHASDSYDRSTR